MLFTNRHRINRYDGSKLLASSPVSDKSAWTVETEVNGDLASGQRLTFSWLAKADERCVNVGTYFLIHDWNRNDYLFSPAALYNGNRYERQYVEHYPPMFDTNNRRTAKDTLVITDVPGFDIESKQSLVQLMSGDCSVPLVGAWFKQGEQALFVLTNQDTALGNNGFDIYEDLEKGTLEIGVMAPIVKQETQYAMLKRKGRPSEYRGVDVEAGTMITQKILIYQVPCQDIHQFYKAYFRVWHETLDKTPLVNDIPFSKAWDIYLNLLNAKQWSKDGYYRDSLGDQWQPGWVGGGMNSLAVLQEGDPASKERALRTLSHLTGIAQSSSGLFYGIIRKGQICGDDFYNLEDTDFHLIRKSGDVLYYLIRHFTLCRKLSIDLKESWVAGARKTADAFVRIWQENGQFGQFVGTDSLKIKVGGSAAGASAIGALALASEFFGDESYRRVAVQAAEYYYKNFLSQGICNGGPGEILQGADSESIYGLLESYVVLYDLTGDDRYLDWAEKAAWHYSSWVVNYQYRYPPTSQFGIHKLDSRGSVFANVQNKHSSPHICTFSGDALFKLYRHTCDTRYMDLLYYTAHNSPNYFSRDDRPIFSWGANPQKLDAGVMCERVNMSDWEGLRNIGGVFNGQCWCSASMALSWADLPGVYLDKDSGKVWNIDHVEATFRDGALHLSNPTQYHASVKVCIEGAEDRRVPLGQAAGMDYERVTLGPGEACTVDV